MKVINKPIDVICHTDIEGNIKPLRIRVTNDDDSVFKFDVDSVIKFYNRKVDKIEMIIFTCRSVINEVQRTYELIYYKNTCKWVLSKM